MSAIRQGPGFTGPVLALLALEAGKASFMAHCLAGFGWMGQLAGEGRIVARHCA
jgi:hypothetical protein